MNKRSGNFRTILIYIIVVGVLIFMLSSLFTGTGQKAKQYSDIVAHFEGEEVTEFFVDNEGIIKLTLKDKSTVTYRLASISFFREDRITLLTSDRLAEMSKEEFQSRAFAWRGRKTVERNLRLLNY